MLFKEKQRVGLQLRGGFRLELVFPAEVETLSGKSEGSGRRKVVELTDQGSWAGPGLGA